MKSTKISEGDISDKKIASLPTRPTTPTGFGGVGYTAAEVKAAFDKLPLYIIERFNELIEDIKGENGGSVTDAVKTGITDTHTLAEFFLDVLSGDACAYFGAPSGTLAEYLTSLRRDVNKIAARLNISL